MVQKLADWQLPPGVSRATWDYVNDSKIATEYDSFHASHGLLQYDQTVVNKAVDSLPDDRPAVVLDLGCGTGRSLMYPHARGHRVIGVDLSEQMLACARQKLDAQCKSDADRQRACLIQANMVEIDCIEPASVDLALCLYSSLGMVRGSQNRRKCLSQVHRCVRSGGRFILHVHNRQNWWLTSAGRKLIMHDWKEAILRRNQHELGDRYYNYRNLPSMFLHIFSQGEVKRLLRDCGFRFEQWVYLDQSSTQPLRSPWLLPRLRSAGFLMVCHRP